MFFTGTYEHAIDPKGRLAIPAPFRQQWKTDVHGGAWFALPWVDDTVRLYTETAFVKLAESVMPQALLATEEEEQLQQQLFGRCARVEMDSAGRIRLPDLMIEECKLGREVALVGARDRLDVMNRDRWAQRSSAGFGDLKDLIAKVHATQQARKDAAG